MNFKQAESYLLSLGNEVTSMKLGLEYIRRLLTELGNPQHNYLKVQIAGTNGKGSVCAFLAAICRSAGILTGLLTSPHLISITERINIDGRDIPEKDFARHATAVRAASEKLVAEGELDSVPTFFEQMTAIAFTAFAENQVEFAILETGLGGRLDAITAASAEIAAITRIDFDHEELLGSSLALIAMEKAAIIHSGSKVVISEQQPDAMKVILERCRNLGVVPRTASEVTAIASTASLKFCSGENEYIVPELGLAGNHQIENAKVAILLAETLKDRFFITRADIIKGLQNARHAGRIELRGKYLFDGAHNVGGAAALREYLEVAGSKPLTLIFGSMKDKDVENISSILFPVAETVILTRPNNPRSFTPAAIAERISRQRLGTKILRSDNVEEALRMSDQNESGGMICVTGSLYLVGEAMKILTDQGKI